MKQYHDEWIFKVGKKIEEIVGIEDRKLRLEKSIELAEMNVAYWQQFVEDIHPGNVRKIYEDSYRSAVVKLLQARDNYMDMVEEDA